MGISVIESVSHQEGEGIKDLHRELEQARNARRAKADNHGIGLLRVSYRQMYYRYQPLSCLLRGCAAAVSLNANIPIRAVHAPGLLLRPIGIVSSLYYHQYLGYDLLRLLKILFLERNLLHVVVAPGLADKSPLHLYPEMFHDEKPIKNSLILMRPVDSILELRILVVHRCRSPIF